VVWFRAWAPVGEVLDSRPVVVGICVRCVISEVYWATQWLPTYQPTRSGYADTDARVEMDSGITK
jgi:hypothetical protein